MAFTISQQLLDDLATKNFSLKIGSFSTTHPDQATPVTGGYPVGNDYYYLYLVADSGYGFLSGSLAVGSYTQGFGVGKPATYGRALLNGNSTGTLTIEAESIPYTPPANLDYNFLVMPDHLEQFSSNNAKLQVNDVDAVIYTPVYQGDVLKAVTIGDFEFFETPSFPYSSVVFRYRTANNSLVEKPFIIGSPAKTATITAAIETRQIAFSVATVQVTPEIVGSNNVYLIDTEILNDINVQRFRTINAGQDVEIVDYGQYILSVLQIPTTISQDFVIESTDIQLGEYTTTVEAPQLRVDSLPIDMGEITVPKTFNNSLDFQNTICNLHLPWAKSVAIEPYYIIGETLGIEYLLDCYTGNVTINLTSSKIGGEVFHTIETSLGVNVPYSATIGYSPSLSNDNVSVGGNNQILTPFIEVVRNDAPLASGFFTAPVVDESALSTNSGYIEVLNVELTFQALADEKSQIETLLASGVIIK